MATCKVAERMNDDILPKISKELFEEIDLILDEELSKISLSTDDELTTFQYTLNGEDSQHSSGCLIPLFFSFSFSLILTFS